MAVQTGYGKAQPVDPRAVELTIRVVKDFDVSRIEPIESYTTQIKSRAMLVTLSLGASTSEQVVVQHPEAHVDRPTRLVFRPEDARELAQCLLKNAEDLDRSDSENPIQ